MERVIAERDEVQLELSHVVAGEEHARVRHDSPLLCYVIGINLCLFPSVSYLIKLQRSSVGGSTRSSRRSGAGSNGGELHRLQQEILELQSTISAQQEELEEKESLEEGNQRLEEDLDRVKKQLSDIEGKVSNARLVVLSVCRHH